MRKIFFFTLLIPMEIFGQDYQTVKSQREYYYHLPYFSNDYPESAAVKIDSAYLMGSDSVLYPFRTFGNWDNGLCSGYNTLDTSWIGEKIMIRSNGDNIFYNSRGDSIVVKTGANMTDTWHLLDSVNGDYMEATLVSASSQLVLGSNDSVKTIILQAKNSSGNNIAHIFNGKQILLGKNSGLILCYNFHLFPSDTTTYTLKGITNPASGAQNITAADIFDFDVGDVFHYRGNYGCSILLPYGDRWSEDSITAKNISGDTVQYVRHHRFYKREMFPSALTVYIDEVDTIRHILSQWASFTDKLPKQRTYYSYYPNALGYSNLLFDIPLYNGRQMKVADNTYEPNPSIDCVNQILGWCIYFKYTFAEGLGQTVIYESQDGRGDSLIYFRKGTETWGTPLNWSVILGTGVELKKDLIKVGPNPFSDFISIDLANNAPVNITVLLINQLGQNVFSQTFVSQNRIEFSTTHISQGIYILTLTEGKNRYHYKLIK